MNHVFVNKIIKGIFKISKNFKIKKGKMGTDQENKPPTTQVATLGANTIIQFTIKSFLATVGTILGIFVSFYFLVVVPRMDKTEQYQKELNDKQSEYFSGELGKVNQAITVNTGSINALTTRFNDLNETFEEIANNGGSFGGGTSMNENAVGEHELSLASNDHN